MPEAGDFPHLGGLAGRRGERARMLHREVVIAVAVHEQQRHRGHPPDQLDRALRHGHPAARVDPHAEEPAGDPAPDTGGDHQVQPAHRRRVPYEPPAGGADRHDRVRAVRRHRGHVHGARHRAAGQRRLPDHARAAHAPPAGDDLAAAEGAQPRHRDVDVQHFAAPQRAATLRPAVAAQVDRQHGAVPRESRRDATHVGPLRVSGETGRDHDADLAVAPVEERGMQADAVGSAQRGAQRKRDRCHARRPFRLGHPR